jgi:hypothetical protein
MRMLLSVWLILAGATGVARAAVVIDGVVDEPEWATATQTANSVASNWTTANRLDRLRAFTDASDLYIAVEGASSGNAIILYADSKPGGIVDLGSLTDNLGVLDNALSSPIVIDGGFAADFGWGTLDMSRSSATADDRMGWRDIATMPDNFIWLYGADYPTACGTSACETRIPLSALGGSGVIRLFVRVCSPSGTYFANQNLPMDNASNPQSVSTWMSVPRSGQTSVPEPTSSAMGLCQHPNPFTAHTTIRFALRDAERIRLAIFDIGGRLVRTLLDDRLPVGSHQAVWDGRDELGSRVAPGCYLARLEAGHRVETSRIALIR